MYFEVSLLWLVRICTIPCHVRTLKWSTCPVPVFLSVPLVAVTGAHGGSPSEPREDPCRTSALFLHSSPPRPGHLGFCSLSRPPSKLIGSLWAPFPQRAVWRWPLSSKPGQSYDFLCFFPISRGLCYCDATCSVSKSLGLYVFSDFLFFLF